MNHNKLRYIHFIIFFESNIDLFYYFCLIIWKKVVDYFLFCVTNIDFDCY
jgi:hypothetical protein